MAMTTNHPVLSKTVSVIFFSVMGWLAVKVAIEHGLARVVLVMLFSIALVSFFSTCLVCAFIGYQSVRAYIFAKTLPKPKWRIVLASAAPFSSVAVMAFLSGGLLFYFYADDIDAKNIILGIVLAIPLAFLFAGAVASALVGMYRR